jgi:rubredoxin
MKELLSSKRLKIVKLVDRLNPRKQFWRLVYKARVFYLTSGGYELPWYEKEEYYKCPNCNWNPEEHLAFEHCLGSYDHHSDCNGGRYWIERWKCSICGEVFDFDTSN